MTSRCQSTGKVQFPTQMHAEIRILSVEKEAGHPLYSYKCPECGYWHFTKTLDFQSLIKYNILTKQP
jgi:uncharacterized OB-fold protein